MRNTKGFTLIELLIVVVIIGILAAIAIPKFANTKEKAYIAGMKSDLRNLVTAQEAYFADNVTYATVLSNLNYSQSAGNTVTVTVRDGHGLERDVEEQRHDEDLRDLRGQRDAADHRPDRRRTDLPVGGAHDAGRAVAPTRPTIVAGSAACSTA